MYAWPKWCQSRMVIPGPQYNIIKCLAFNMIPCFMFFLNQLVISSVQIKQDNEQCTTVYKYDPSHKVP